MKFNLNTLLLALLAILTIIFLVPGDNRNTLTAPHTLTLPGLGTFERVPVGTYLLVAWLVTALLYTLINSVSRLRNQADSAKLLRDMESLRINLDKAEGSRFAELQTYLERRLNELQTQISAQASETTGQAARMTTLRNELAADLGQMDNYLKRKLGE
ncbi:LapA family protein [Deinococcus sp. KNUC1210]|uniref:LapA family protein n=1 Tax=Deinococcus sp. KNUC1210 TaxID=2917691 RepID=UPI001EEF7D2B|nr:LapA family protein [Deinococcus sp. KNUC1210]ULH14848.1 LapA family protein [Deinococcus sp. KNUC1210]